MAVVATVSSVKMTLSLEAGTDAETGKTVNKSLTVGGLDAAASNDGIMAFEAALAPCLAYPVGLVRKTVISTLESGE